MIKSSSETTEGVPSSEGGGSGRTAPGRSFTKTGTRLVCHYLGAVSRESTNSCKSRARRGVGGGGGGGGVGWVGVFYEKGIIGVMVIEHERGAGKGFSWSARARVEEVKKKTPGDSEKVPRGR